MMTLNEKLKKEKEKLEMMIEVHGWQLNNDIILEQSRKVDKLVVLYQQINHHIRNGDYDENKFVKANG